MTPDARRKRLAFRRIVAAVAALNADETEAAAYILGRFAGGAKVYGHYDARKDRRNFAAEAAAEDADWYVYRALGWHRRQGVPEVPDAVTLSQRTTLADVWRAACAWWGGR